MEKQVEKQKFYVTTAIDYVNASPHLGHAYEKIYADAIARWKKLNGFDVFFLTGTDENAIKIARAAKEAGAKSIADIQAFVDANAEKFKKLCEILDVKYSYFIRTTEERHRKAAQKFFELLYKNGYIYKAKYKGLYCVSCEAFYKESEVADGLCPVHKKKLEVVEEENYFFKLSEFKDKIIAAIENGLIKPEKYAREILARLKQETLKDLSVTRQNLEWGIKVPFDESQTIYVWIDALSNYITALDWPDGNAFRHYWPADLHLIGKDINWFHSVIWPALLMAAGIELPKCVFVHGFINIGGEKLSKTRGILVDPFELVNKYGSDAIRYYLLKASSYGDDFDYSEEEIKEGLNSELADKYGNLVARVIGLAKKINSILKKVEIDEKLEQFFKEKIEAIKKDFDEYKFNFGIKKIFELIDFCNKYIQDNELWKQEGENLNSYLYFLAEAIRQITILLWPILPSATEKIARLYGFEIKSIEQLEFGLKDNYLFKEKEIIFRKVE